MRLKSARIFLRNRFRSRIRAIAWPASSTPTAAMISLRTQLRRERRLVGTNRFGELAFLTFFERPRVGATSSGFVPG